MCKGVLKFSLQKCLSANHFHSVKQELLLFIIWEIETLILVPGFVFDY